VGRCFTPSDDASQQRNIYGTTTPLLSVSEDAQSVESLGACSRTTLTVELSGARIYALVPSTESQFFAINASSGELRVGSAGRSSLGSVNVLPHRPVQDADPHCTPGSTVQRYCPAAASEHGLHCWFRSSCWNACATCSQRHRCAPCMQASVTRPSVDALVTTRGFGDLLVYGTWIRAHCSTARARRRRTDSCWHSFGDACYSIIWALEYACVCTGKRNLRCSRSQHRARRVQSRLVLAQTSRSPYLSRAGMRCRLEP